MRYAIIGTGAIGGFYGGRLAKAGIEVHFLAHSDYREMKERLTVDSWEGNFTIERPMVYDSTATMPPVDVVIVALKTTSQGIIPGLLAPLMASGPTVLLIQNGLCVEPDLQARMPEARLAAGLAFICSKKPGPAHIYHEDYGKLTLAGYSAPDTDIEAIAADFRHSGIATDVTDYAFGRWRKAIWNLPFNGLCVVTGMDTHQLLASAEHRRLILEIMHEVVAIANATGVGTLGESHIQKNIDDTLAMKPYWPSMKVDYDNHRPLEIHYLYTRAIDEARRVGVPVPRLEELRHRLVEVSAAAGLP